MSMASHPRPSWSIELGARARKTFAPTVIFTTLLTGLFFCGYFYVQRHPAYTPIVMPLTRIDRLIPFQPRALLAYVSLWIYIGAGPGLQRTFAGFAWYGLWVCSLCLCGLAIFYFWPTQVPASMWHDTAFPGFALLHRVDESGNACPSMHVAVATFTAVSVDKVLRSTRAPLPLRLLNAAWLIVIAYSTLAIKQHVVLDAAAGALLGLLFVLPCLRTLPTRPDGRTMGAQEKDRGASRAQKNTRRSHRNAHCHGPPAGRIALGSRVRRRCRIQRAGLSS